MHDPAEFLAKLEVLSAAYRAQLPNKIQQIMLAWKELTGTEWNEQKFASMLSMVHQMSGSGKTFGYADLSVAARTLENHLNLIVAKKDLANQSHIDKTNLLLVELSQAATHRDVVPVDHVNDSVARADKAGDAAFGQVVIVEDDLALSAELQVQLSYFGYDVKTFHTPHEFRATLGERFSGVVLMDVSFPGDSLGGINIMREIQQERLEKIPVVFMSSHNELHVRLGAVRSGGIAYLTKPLNISALVDKLDELAATQTSSAYRVLIVEDSQSLAAFYAAALEHAGMVTKVVTDPLMVLEPLIDFSPDLILVDMYMPGCDGTELAQLIRQMDAFISIPIVFLSGETRVDKQLMAIGLGGDDFLTKPIEVEHLISSVTSRIKRSLMLRSFMIRDSLTGLLNHTAIKDKLLHELALANRLEKPISFAMVDIDHFKSVNDTYGHPVGDRVIKSLARMLKQRLRSCDLIGRYGGEEFAVILIDAHASSALKILDRIREDFSQLKFIGKEGQEFSVSFSGGVADISMFNDASKLIDASDKALYKAKHVGRNQLKIASAKSS